MIAWDVTFKRDRFTQPYKTERLVIVTPENRLQEVLDALRLRHPEAIIETMETIGEALVHDTGAAELERNEERDA